MGYHLFLREDFLLRHADHLQPKFHPRSRAGAPGPRHLWAAQTDASRCHFTRLCLSPTAGESLVTFAGSSYQSSDHFDRKQKSGFGRSPISHEFPASFRFLPVHTCLQASRLWQFNWCVGDRAGRSRQGWLAFWKKTPLRWVKRAVIDRPKSPVYRQNFTDPGLKSVG